MVVEVATTLNRKQDPGWDALALSMRMQLQQSSVPLLVDRLKNFEPSTQHSSKKDMVEEQVEHEIATRAQRGHRWAEWDDIV